VALILVEGLLKMEEIDKIQGDMRKIKMKNRLLSVAHPYFGLQLSTALILVGSVSKHPVALGLGLALVASSLISLDKQKEIGTRKNKNNELYFKKAVLLDTFVTHKVSEIMETLKYEENPRVRQNMLQAVRTLKKQNVIRQEDKKALTGLTGKKRKGLALGLKSLRKDARNLTLDAYLERRENILSYF
jgi:hypothetical protein